MNKRISSSYLITSALLILLSSTSIVPNAHARPSKPKKAELADPTEPNQLMPLIKSAYAEGRYSDFARLSAKLPANSVFTPYTEIWQFRFFQKGQEKQSADNDIVWKTNDIEPVLNKNAGSWPAEQLRRDWVQQLARAGQWDTFQQQRPKLKYRPDQGVECADLLYASTQGQLPTYKINAVIGTDKRLPKTCRALLKNLYNRDLIKGEDLDRHVLNLVANKQLTPAIQFVNDMIDTAWGQNIEAKTLDNVLDKPDRALKNPPSGTDLYLAAALARKASEDYEQAAELIRSTFKSKLSKNSEKWLWGHLGYRAGLVWDVKALDYFKRSSPDALNPEQQEWKVRAALLTENWPAVLEAINDMSPNLKDTRTWQYWRGRALAASGKVVEARQEWIRAANTFSFYGKLSSEELGNSITAPKKPEPITSAENNWASRNPGLIRTLALYDAGLRAEGLWEFNLQVAQMNDRELLATAAWAEKNKLYDRAIAAADRTEQEHDLNLRYLTPFREQMRAKAAEAGVDESWVYGLIRQESRFMTIARSAVGASGLMQVMPATAQYVAKKIGLNDFQKKDLNEVNTNLTLGTNYLKIVLDQHGQSPVLASASYNAGPGRPTLWKRRLGENREIEGAIFTELIPFDETRDYVKNVMSNTVAYSLVLNNNATTSLKQRLGSIRGTN